MNPKPEAPHLHRRPPFVLIIPKGRLYSIVDLLNLKRSHRLTLRDLFAKETGYAFEYEYGEYVVRFHSEMEMIEFKLKWL